MTKEDWKREHLSACKKKTAGIKVSGRIISPRFEESCWSSIGVTFSHVRVMCLFCGDKWEGSVRDEPK